MSDAPWKLLLFSPVQAADIAFEAPHQHAHHELVMVAKGAYRAQLRTGEVHAAVGDVVVYPREFWHHPRWVEHGSRLLVVACSGPDAEIIALPRTTHDYAGHVLALAHRMWHMVHYERCDDAVGAAALRLLVHEVATAGSRRGGRVETVVQDWIRDHLAEPVALADLAQAAGLGRHHFLRSFRARTGVTPLAYIRAARIEEARRLLRWTDLPLKAIARRVGICHAYHLSHLVKRATGLSPTALRMGRNPDAAENI